MVVLLRGKPPTGTDPSEATSHSAMDLINPRVCTIADADSKVVPLVTRMSLSWTKIAVDSPTLVLTDDAVFHPWVMRIIPNTGNDCSAANRSIIFKVGHHEDRKFPLLL
jgi:hypothetical protein